MKYTYKKGVRFERDLLHFLHGKGFSVVRQASSGGYVSPVDLVAIKRGLILGIECKAHTNKPKLKKDKLTGFKEWCERAGAMGFLAWRSPGNVWKFLRLEDAEKNKYEDENWFEMENFLAALNFR